MQVSTSYLNKQNKKISEKVYDIYDIPSNELMFSLWEITKALSNIKEREKEAEHLFKEIVTENFPNLQTNVDNQVDTDERSKMIFSSKRISLANQTLKRETEREVERDSFESSKRKEKYHRKGSINKITSRFLSRKLVGQETWHGPSQTKKS